MSLPLFEIKTRNLLQEIDCVQDPVHDFTDSLKSRIMLNMHNRLSQCTFLQRSHLNRLCVESRIAKEQSRLVKSIALMN